MSRTSKLITLLKNNIYAYDLLAGLYILLAIILSKFYFFRIDFSLVMVFKYDLKFLQLVILYIVIDMLIALLRIVRRNSRTSPFRFFFKVFRRKYLNFRQLFHLLKVLLWLKLVLFVYCNIKQAIPFINPHRYDTRLLAIDRFFGFGYEPYQIAVYHFGNVFISNVIDKFYFMWYILKPFVIVFFASLPVQKNYIHKRFFFVYFAMWIFCGLLAVMLPSLGPVYMDPEAFQNVYKPLASQLQQSLGVHYLKALMHPDRYKLFIYEGIAAFPSLHVGIIAVFAFFIYPLSRLLGTLMFVYLIIVEFGSVLLGWHYAVDGIFATCLAYLLFKWASYMIPEKSSL